MHADLPAEGFWFLKNLSDAPAVQRAEPAASNNLPPVWFDLPNPGRGPTGPLPPITSGLYTVGATMMDPRQFKLLLRPA